MKPFSPIGRATSPREPRWKTSQRARPRLAWKARPTRPLLTLLCALWIISPASAQLTHGWDHFSNTEKILSDTIIANTNNGAVYDSYTLFFEDLANQIYDSNPNLHTNYASAADLTAAGMFEYGIQPKPPSEVADGWYPDILTNGDIRLNHYPIPLPYYDVWKASQQSANYRQNGTLSIYKLPFLDLNGDGVWDSTNDLTIANDNSTIVLGGQAETPGGFFFYHYIPRIIVKFPTRTLTLISQHPDWFGTNTIGNPEINTIPTNQLALPLGSSVTSSVETYVYDTNTPHRRLKALFP